MASQELKTKVIHICSDVEDFYDSYDVSDIDEEQDLQEYISRIGDLKRNFRRVYAELKTAEGTDFAKNFPNFEKDLKELNETFKIASEKLSNIRKEGKTDVSKQDELKKKRLEQAELEDKKRLDDMKNCVNSLFIEIDVQYKSLTKV